MNSLNTIMFRIFFLALILSAPTGGRAVTLIDQIGRTVSVPDDPQRIVSLMPSLTEMVFDLGQGEKVVAVTQYSRRPEAVRQLP